jgi:hypothetical protein
MVAVKVPPGLAGCAEDALRLRTWLSAEQKIEVALGYYNDAAWLRIAAQAYNEERDYTRLRQVIAEKT